MLYRKILSRRFWISSNERGQKYHLYNFSTGIPMSGKEISNHSHSSLRVVIEHTFDVLKKKCHFKGYVKL
ncbi:hypothetical protein GQ457_18G011310 [Hibiscus cannabinus]